MYSAQSVEKRFVIEKKNSSLRTYVRNNTTLVYGR